MDYEQAMKEISLNELTNGGCVCPALAAAVVCDQPSPPPPTHTHIPPPTHTHMHSDPMYVKMQKELMEKHEAEKEGQWCIHSI